MRPCADVTYLTFSCLLWLYQGGHTLNLDNFVDDPQRFNEFGRYYFRFCVRVSDVCDQPRPKNCDWPTFFNGFKPFLFFSAWTSLQVITKEVALPNK